MHHKTKMFVIVPAVTAITLLSSVFTAGLSKVSALEFLQNNPGQVQIISQAELNAIDLENIPEGVLILPIAESEDESEALQINTIHEVYDSSADGSVQIVRFEGNKVDILNVVDADFEE